MLVTRTPLRIPFFSGGSDMPAFYTKEPGAAFSATINKFIYVVLHRTPHLGIRMMHDTVEAVTELDDMHHDIAREVLRYFNITKDVTVASVSDVLAKGSGLGSSSAFTVGMIKAVKEMEKDKFLSLVIRRQLAETACDIEMNKCGFPVGKQDQYAATYGGFNLFEFDTDGKVMVNHYLPPLDIQDDLQDNLLLVYSGIGRKANDILQKQQKAMSKKKKFDIVRANKELAYTAFNYLKSGYVDGIGELLNESWQAKRQVAKEISSPYFDMIYDVALDAGALGGKILGAGGGGFLLFYVKPARRNDVIEELREQAPECQVYDFAFYNQGTSMLCHDYEY